jgi:glyoxalase family protein
MRLEGIHHITAITADAQANIDFYAGTLGLRLVKKTVNQDQPSVYHLFYADEKGSAGADLTFFEFRDAPIGRAGAGMVHRIVWRVGSTEALEFWELRLRERGVAVGHADEDAALRYGPAVRFRDPEGLEHELLVSKVDDQPLIADHPEVPAEFALQGFDGARAYSADPAASEALLSSTLGFTGEGAEWEVRGNDRGGLWAYDEPPAEPGMQAAGTVHHIAFASQMDDHEAWRQRVIDGGLRPTPIIDRFWFHSVYFREPSGVLFEIATLGPGFGIDEDPEHLGETLILPPFLEDQREEIEAALVPVTNPRQAAATP